MAKPAASKKAREPSKHSRASRRATSIDIDTDKSLKDVKPPTQSTDYRPAVLQAHHGAGVTKKAKSGRKSALSSKARKRKEKGMDRAENYMENKAIRVEKSKNKGRTIQTRAKGWEDINKQIPEQQKKFPTEDDIVDEDGNNNEEDVSGVEGQAHAGEKEWETDEEMDAAAATNGAEPIPQAQADDIDEEIL